MENNLSNKVFLIKGMTCSSCELRIENTLRRMDGVSQVKVSLAESKATITFNSAKLTSDQLKQAITKLGYEVIENGQVTGKSQTEPGKFTINQLLGMGIVVFAIYWLIKSTVGFNFIPQVDQSVGYGMLFVVGLLTSLHCIAMCGGINLSQCIKVAEDEDTSWFTKFRPSLLYNLGRIVSYTIVGGIAGAIGSVVSFSGTAKGIVSIIAGLFMVIMGINMVGIFPWLQKFNLRLPKLFGNKVYNNNGKHGPFIVGLLNGLMPCGPLQTMQLYALGTGSFINGAIAMFLFSLGTVPLMFGFGAISSLLSKKFTHRMMKASAILVIVLGLIMVGRGLNLSGYTPIASASPNSASVAKLEGGVQVVTTTVDSGRYYPIIVQKGIPVRWTIKAKADDLNGCNNPITIPKYNIQKTLVPGDNIIEFTPGETGNITYTCWMGMISSNIRVVDDLTNVSKADLDQGSGGVSGGVGGSCCSAGAQATRFYGGRIPVDDLVVAKVVDGRQEISITVNDAGFSPAAIVLQRGVKTKIKFNPEKLNYCNSTITFPEYRGQLDLSGGQLETPELTTTQDFTFQCWMGMLNGYFKVVDDVNNINLKEIKKEISEYKPAGGGGCCG